LPVIRYIETEFGFIDLDVLTTAGGSKTISLCDVDCNVDEKESLFFELKNRSLWIDFEKYLSHGAKTVVIVDHSNCGAWREFQGEIEEEKEHRKSLVKAGEIITSKCKQIGRVILLYAIIDNSAGELIEIKEIFH
jgi:hypothetical protein